MSRVLLINPPKEMPLLDWTMRYPPLGLMSIAAGLDGHEVEILDMKAEKTKRKELPGMLGPFDIVGITALTPSFDAALELCRTARGCGALTVLGGVHPTLMPEVVAYPEVDIVVRGEGELTFKEIADGRPLESIQGISYVSGPAVVHNPDRPPADLNTLPPPRRDLVAGNSRRYKAFGQTLGALSTARGCPYGCSFCCVPRVWKGYRELSPVEVVNELKRMDKTELVSIVDDNFCQDMGRVGAICDLIVREGLNDRLYSVFSRVDSIVGHPEVVAKMARANMRVVFIGIEAATQAALDRMNKKTRIEDTHRACQILEENGILIWAGNIVGNLDDTYEDVEALIRMNIDLPIDISDFTVITPWPGTDLHQLASEQGLIDNHDFTEYCECEPHMHTLNLSRLELLELEIKAYIKLYGFLPMARRVGRWSRTPQKRWLIKRDYKGFHSFLQFRNKSAFYFWRTYREMVGKTEGTRIRRHSLLVSTPVLYSIGSGITSALIALLLTILAGRLYGTYTSYPLAFVVTDLLLASAFVAFTIAAIATWYAIRSYRRGWIFSVRQRKPAGMRLSVSSRSFLSGAVFSASALVLTAMLLTAFVASGNSSELTYGMKEVLVTVIAFFTSGLASYIAIRAVRNGNVFGPADRQP